MEIESIKVSVRNLVEFVLRCGDIDTRQGVGIDKNAMEAGNRIHRKIQKSMGSCYQSEVPLRLEYQLGRFCIQIEGRADGIITKDGKITIDEIKGVYRRVEEMQKPEIVHLAQARCYAYIYAVQHKLDTIDIQMTYCNLDTEIIQRFVMNETKQKLTKWFESLIEEYQRWIEYAYENHQLRQMSISNVEFPYPYRGGQHDMVATVYSAIYRKRNLFVQAPTGIGKTLATIFPAIKAVGEGLGDKIFYLTAKTITRTVAVEGFDKLREQGLHFKTIVITAKEKMCILEEPNCNPETCAYARGHYDRINEAIYDIITNETNITREILLDYATRYQVCPFEFELDVSLWVDGIICDYNYVFDPRVNLKRYFAQGVKGDYIFLVDEAHNLYERASQMYSAQLYKEDFLEVKRIVKPFSEELAQKLEQCNKEMLSLKKLCNSYLILEQAGGLVLKLMKLLTEYESFLLEHRTIVEEKKILELYFQVYNFLAIYEQLDENYVIYCENETSQSFKIKLYCVDTSNNLKLCLEKGNATIFFSATLLPIQYYKELLGNQEDYAIYIPSPFDSANRQLLIGEDVSSKYTRRGPIEYQKIYEYLKKIVTTKTGNYMIFFPSYRMMEDVYEIAISDGIAEEMVVIRQEQRMSEESRDQFLHTFEEQKVVAFCIMGGIFSEGIDLVAERLIGAVIVGTGIPMVCNEREILMNYFSERKGKGFEYAYLYPGMNKVMQAAGRVIRTNEDRGVIALLDERFLGRQYQELFPREWKDYQITQLCSVDRKVAEFWERWKC